MKLPIISKDKINNPLKGFGFAFIDEEDKKLKIKKHDSIIEFCNELSDIQLLNLTDYTAFEVYPTDHEIPANTIDDITGYTYKYEVPAQMTHKVNVRTTAPINLLDVIVDWGDNNIDVLKNGDYESVSSSGYTYTLSHTYEIPGKYIVKIYGNQYFALAHAHVDNNIMSRCLDHDLPIASHLTNLSSFACNSKKLLKVDCPFSKIMYRIINTSSMFANCSNLIQATGFGSYVSPAMLTCSWMFQNCPSMSECDFILPSYFSDTWGIKGTFAYCKSLAVDINSLLPPQGFHVKEPNVHQLFIYVPLTGTVPVEKLFGDPDIVWQGYSSTFKACPEAIRAQVPVSWGGTASDDIIEKSLEEKYNDLLTRLEKLENA